MNGKLSITQIKQQHRTAKRQVARAKKRVEKMLKLRTETFSLVDQLAKLAQEEAELSSYTWTPNG